MQAPSRLLLISLVCAACGGSSDAGSANVQAAPARAGDLWEVDNPEDRQAVPAALLAFVSGTHVMVLDGDEAFAGMTALVAKRADGDARTIELGNGISAQIVPAGDAFELRFASGERIPLRKRVVPTEEK